MSTGSVNKGIKNSWSLTSFAKAHGRMQLGNFRNSETGDSFKSCIFTDETTGSRVFVSFSSNLGELSAAEIKAQVSDLQVVELESGTYKLCHTGNDSWEDVELF
jgi:hypothetical protein